MFRPVTVLMALTAITTAGGPLLLAHAETPHLSFKTADLITRTSSSITIEAQAADTLSIQQQNTTFSHIQFSIRSGKIKSRGVNLGGWLVAEHWMSTDAEFWNGLSDDDANAGEYSAITKAADSDAARALIQKHHDMFITETDIKAIADAGLNTVRVPVGFWIAGFDKNDSPQQQQWSVYAKDTLKYLDVLIRQWAKRHNLAVLISIHGAKGSQNGADHSSPTVKGKAFWSDYPENVANTVTLASFLADRYRADAAFMGIGLLNEPTLSTTEAVLYQYYEDAYRAIRATGNDCVLTVAPLLVQQNADAMVGFMQRPQYTNVWVEWHPYFVWGYESTSASDLIAVSVQTEFQTRVNTWQARTNHNRLFFGEWSFATSADKFTGDNKDQFYAFAEAQANVQNQADGGWTFWTWKASSDDSSALYPWSLRSVLRDKRLKGFLLGK